MTTKTKIVLGVSSILLATIGYFIWKRGSNNKNNSNNVGVKNEDNNTNTNVNKCDATLLKDNYYSTYFKNGYPDILCVDYLKPYTVEFYNWTAYKYIVDNVQFVVEKKQMSSSDNETFNYVPFGEYYVLKADENSDGAVIYDLNGVFYQKLLK